MEPQNSISRRPSSQVAGVEPQNSISRRPSSQVAGGEPQNSDEREDKNFRKEVKAPEVIDKLKEVVKALDTENSDEREDKNFRKEAKTPEVIDKLKEVVKALDTENSDEREDKNFRKEVKAPEVIDKLKEVVKALDTENSKIVFHSHSTESLESPQNSKTVFHSNSTESLESPQTPRIGGDFLETDPTARWTCNPAASWTCNPTTSWTCNLAASWTCNPATSWTCNLAASWTCNLAANWTCNPAASWTCNPAANWTCNPAGFNKKKNFFKELEGTVNHDVPEIGFHNEVTVNTVNHDVPEIGFHNEVTVNTVNHEDVPEIGFTHKEITINKVHQSTRRILSCLKVIIVMLIVFYKEFGEDSEFFNDCLATQKELEKSVHSGPRFLILLKNQKGPKNKTIVEELEKRTQSPLHPYRLYVHMENQNGSKDETSLKELEGRALGAPEPNVMYSVHCTVQYYAGAIDEDTDERKHKDRDDDERPGKDPPSCAGFPAVTTNMDAGKNKMENRVTDIDTDKNQMADVVKTKANDRDCVGTHLTPAPETLLKHAGREPGRGLLLRGQGGLRAHPWFLPRSTRGSVRPRCHLQVTARHSVPSIQSAGQCSGPTAGKAVTQTTGFGAVYSEERARTLRKNSLVICRNLKNRGKVKSNLTFPKYNLRLRSQG